MVAEELRGSLTEILRDTGQYKYVPGKARLQSRSPR